MSLNPSCASHPNSPFLLWSHWHLEGLGCQQGPVKRKNRVLHTLYTFYLCFTYCRSSFAIPFKVQDKQKVAGLGINSYVP